ncbi:MAG: hypothetical protein HQL63_02275 [Magnetococcales bacterium]|nr:hypothetical protein [Magnetococcales bacterium]MBF0322911.1 hypothetical protein [Magnetococcales bacterium]
MEFDPVNALHVDYLEGKRHAFKEAMARVNRLPEYIWPAACFPGPTQGIAGALFARGWLLEHVHPRYHADVLAVSRNRQLSWLVDLLQHAENSTIPHFVDRFLTCWWPEGLPDRESLVQRILGRWEAMDPFRETRQTTYRRIQAEQKREFGAFDDAFDRERLDLLDRLPDPAPGSTRLAKAGLVPGLACRQSCRHCMFVWRPPTRHAPDPGPLFDLVNTLSNKILFTGGDLSGHMDSLLRALRTMDRVSYFAVLLNGDFAESLAAATEFFAQLRQALASRPRHASPAEVMVQISFDEFHQEILADRHGNLSERIPVARIAHIMVASLAFPDIQLTLLHKQNRLNFANELFRRGVFSRLARELGQLGHRLEVRACSASPRLKADPVNPAHAGSVIRDVLLVLADQPQRIIQMTSSTIDAHGRAERLDPSEYINERAYMQRILAQGPPDTERFDTDLMFHYHGPVTLFAALHYTLGDWRHDAAATILARHRKDPLCRALEKFAAPLLDLYAEVQDDLPTLLERATGPHHLFHRLTREGRVRLHLTRRLLCTDPL